MIISRFLFCRDSDAVVKKMGEGTNPSVVYELNCWNEEKEIRGRTRI